MNVLVKYFNKRNGTIEAMNDYGSMKTILQNTDRLIREAYENMESVGSPKVTGLPGAHDPKAGEARLVSGLDDISILRDRYAQAKAYMEWFQPAWDALDEYEQYVLRTFYLDSVSRCDAIEAICDHFHVERSTAYNKKNKALSRLSVLLFGK
jgi:hypothetical protein